MRTNDSEKHTPSLKREINIFFFAFKKLFSFSTCSKVEIVFYGRFFFSTINLVSEGNQSVILFRIYVIFLFCNLTM